MGARSTFRIQTKWLSTGKAAKRLGLTTRTVYRLIDEGLLPAYKIGRVIRLKQLDVDDFIEASRVKPGTLAHLYPSAVDDEGAGR